MVIWHDRGAGASRDALSSWASWPRSLSSTRRSSWRAGTGHCLAVPRSPSTAWRYRQSCETFDEAVAAAFVTAHHARPAGRRNRALPPGMSPASRACSIPEAKDLLFPPLAG